MHWVLSQFHAISKNWGVAIILLVLLIKGVTWKLTAVQYKSGAKMRKLAPRIAQLKERYGDDRSRCSRPRWSCTRRRRSIRWAAACRY